MLRINLSTLRVFSITGLAHQTFDLLQLLLQEAYTLSQLFLAWEGIFNSDVVVRCHTHWGADAFEQPLDINLIHIGANKQADCRIFIICLQQLIHSIRIIVQLACKLWLKWLGSIFLRQIHQATPLMIHPANGNCYTCFWHILNHYSFYSCLHLTLSSI